MIPLHTLTLVSLCLLLQVLKADTTENERPWNEEIIYFVITDRFLDGDPLNNLPTGSDPNLFDPSQTDIDHYHGGDFRGLEIALQNGYFNDLGITAIWITPPVRNVWYSLYDSNDSPKTGYHGYWTQDFLDIDPHLVSRESLDGTRSYPDTREGRLAHYRDFVELAHSKGIRIIQDVVLNHAGPVFYYDANGDQKFDLNRKEEWIQPFKDDGFHGNTRWGDVQKWNLLPTEPSESVELLGERVEITGALASFESYGRKGFSADSLGQRDGEEVVCDFLSLRDFWTAPDSPHFDDLVDDFVEIYAFYIETIGVDGLRIDTVKHVHHEFWDAFTERLREKLGPERSQQLILFGEVYDGDPEALGRYTYRADWPASKEPSIDSLLNFQFNYAVREYLRTGNDSVGSAQAVAEAINALSPEIPSGSERPFFNQTPGADGLNSSEKMIHFVENHDGINRFRVRGVSARRNFLANALALTMPGIPCLYYGTEASLQDTKACVHEDAETGRMTLYPKDQTRKVSKVREAEDFKNLADLIEIRKDRSALTSPDIQTLWVDSPAGFADDGLFAFARGTAGADPILVIVNAGKSASTTSADGHLMKLTDSSGQRLLQPSQALKFIQWNRNSKSIQTETEVKLLWQNGVPYAAITVPAESLNLLEIVDQERN